MNILPDDGDGEVAPESRDGFTLKKALTALQQVQWSAFGQPVSEGPATIDELNKQLAALREVRVLTLFA